MNYILLHYSYGYESVPMAINAMKEQCNAVAKKNSGEWYEYVQTEKSWRKIPSIMNVLTGHNNFENNNIINWGNHIFSQDEYFRLNKPSGIANASNKGRARRILQDAGVAVPKTYFWANLEECKEVTYPIIVRPSYHHGGQHFNVFNTPQEVEAFLWGKQVGTWYASELFHKTHEYRVHVAHGKILSINDKPLVEGEIRANHAVNHESWRAIKWHEYDAIVPACVESIRAVQVLGLDYGAVDIMWNANEGKAAIAEVNTSPSINTEYTSGKYAAYFDWVIRHNFPAHFPIEGKSVFYNKILES